MNSRKLPTLGRLAREARPSFLSAVLCSFAITITLPASAQDKPRPTTKPRAAAVEPQEVRVEEQKDAYFLTGIAKRQQGLFREAVDDLTVFVSGDDRNPDAHWELAVAHALYCDARPTAEGRRKAVEHFRRSFELSPGIQRTLPPAASSKPSIVAMVQEAKKAAGVVTEASAAPPIDAEGLLRLAESQADSGDIFEAKKNFDDVRMLPPPPPIADRERVRSKLEKAVKDRILQIQSIETSNIVGAQTEAGKLLRFFPDEPIALETYVRLQLRYSKLAMEGIAGAKIYQQWRNAIEGFMLKGQLRDALFGVNTLLFSFPRDEYGERKYSEILRRNDEALRAAEEAYNQKRYEEARRKFEEIRNGYPDAGSAQDVISEIDEVRRKLESSLEREQERGNSAGVYAIAKDLGTKFPSSQKAKDAVKAAVADANARLAAGMAALDGGRQFEAIEGFQKALEIVPGQSGAEDGIAKARAALRDVKRQMWEGMERIPDGTYVLGGEYPESKPKNKAASLKAFALDRHRVSNAAYRLFVLGTGAKAPETWKGGQIDPTKVDFPVTGISHDEAESFCRWLGKRLPTEFEWEKAARGSGGLDLPYDNAPSSVRKQFSPFTEYPIGRFPGLASPYGIEELVGPAFEWTSSWFAAYPGNDEAAIRISPPRTFKVVRGGARSPSMPPANKPLESAFREKRNPDRREPDLSFRCAATIATPPDWLATEATPEKVGTAPGDAVAVPVAASAPVTPR